MATRKSTTESAPRIVWTSAEGRAVVLRHGPKDYEARLDGKSAGFFDYSFKAEHELGVLLHQQAEELARDLADEQAERDAAHEAATPEVHVALVSDEGGPLYTDFVCGDVSLGISDEGAALAYGDSISEADLPTLRKLRAIFTHPALAAMLAPVSPAVIMRECWADKDEPVVGLEFACGSVEVLLEYDSDETWVYHNLDSDALLPAVEDAIASITAITADARYRLAQKRRDSGLHPVSPELRAQLAGVREAA